MAAVYLRRRSNRPCPKCEGNKFYIARKRSGLTRGEVSEQLGVSVATIQTWEMNEALPQNLFLFQRIADLYGTTVRDLLGYDVADAKTQKKAEAV